MPTNGFAWFLEGLGRYAEFHGRSRRREFWYFFLFNLVFSTACSVIDHYLRVRLANLVYTLATFIPAIAVEIRRFHDVGRSGWWTLLPLINLIFLVRDGDPGANRYGRPTKPTGPQPLAA